MAWWTPQKIAGLDTSEIRGVRPAYGSYGNKGFEGWLSAKYCELMERKELESKKKFKIVVTLFV